MNCKALEAKGFSATGGEESSTLLVLDPESRCSATGSSIQTSPCLHVVLLHHRRFLTLETLHFRSVNRY